MGYQAVLDAIRSLPVDEQVKLVHQLQDDFESQGVNPELTPEVMEELDRRIADVEVNPNDGVPWTDVLAEARRRHNQ